MMIKQNEKPSWVFYPGWVVLNIVAVILAWYISWAIISQITAIVGGRIMIGGQSRITEDALFVYVILPMIGLLTGIAQYILIRRYLPRMAWWIAFTFLGWLMPIALGRLISKFLTPNNDIISIMLGLFLIGVSIALPQWWLLRKRVSHAFWWIIAYGVSWGMLGALSNFTTEPFPVLLAVSLLPTIATAIVWWLFLDWFPSKPDYSISL